MSSLFRKKLFFLFSKFYPGGRGGLNPIPLKMIFSSGKVVGKLAMSKEVLSWGSRLQKYFFDVSAIKKGGE